MRSGLTTGNWNWTGLTSLLYATLLHSSHGTEEGCWLRRRRRKEKGQDREGTTTTARAQAKPRRREASFDFRREFFLTCACCICNSFLTTSTVECQSWSSVVGNSTF